MDQIRQINKFKFDRVYRKKCPGYKYIPSTLPAVKRLLVLGDIHGDYKLLITMLRMSGIIDCPETDDPNLEEVRWVGGSSYVVQVGDQIDDCRPFDGVACENQDGAGEDIKILTLCTRLHQEAVRSGGAFISLLGNHEILNVLGDTTYVSKNNLEDFQHKYPTIGSGVEARKYAFHPGNDIATMLGCGRLPAVIVGRHLFVHAGIIDPLIQELGLDQDGDLETINMAIRLWLLGVLKEEYITELIKFSGTSMFWTRILGEIPPDTSLADPKCSQYITQALQLFKVGSIIVGHTPQSFTKNKDINAACDKSVWRVDNGSSQAFDKFDEVLDQTGRANNNRRPQVLEIINDTKYYIIDQQGRRRV